MHFKTIIVILITAAFAVLCVFAYVYDKQQYYSPEVELTTLWSDYKSTYIDHNSFRTIDPDRGNITTSEGESYTMLRAVWLGDKLTFDKSWEWTKNNLQKNTGIFSWLYGTRSDGSLGVLTDQG